MFAVTLAAGSFAPNAAAVVVVAIVAGLANPQVSHLGGAKIGGPLGGRRASF